MLSRGESGSFYTNTNSPTHSMLYWYGLVFGGSVPAVTEQVWAVTEKSWKNQMKRMQQRIHTKIQK